MNASGRHDAWSRLRQIVKDEVSVVGFDRLAAEAISRTLPQLAFGRARTAALRALGMKLGAHTTVLGPLRISGQGDIRRLIFVGDEVVITGPLHIDMGAEVHIGHRVFIGHDVALLTVNHRIGSSQRRCADVVLAPVVVGEGVWIASRVTVLPGVTIGSGTVIGAGSVVTRDVPPNVLAVGSPARVVRSLDAPSGIGTEILT
jgi:acetyltransferase-like isoleucine patch superfamily enzyme